VALWLLFLGIKGLNVALHCKTLHFNESSSYVGLISRKIKMAFAGILKDDDVAAALKECAGKTQLSTEIQ